MIANIDTRSINPEELVTRMQLAGRGELVHYAGASTYDRAAFEMCREYLQDPKAPEHVLASRAIKAAYGWDVTPEQVLAVMQLCRR